MITKQDIKAMDDETFFKLYVEIAEENSARLRKAQNKAWDEVKHTMLNYIQKFGPINVAKTYGGNYVTLGCEIHFPEDLPGEITDCKEDKYEHY